MSSPLDLVVYGATGFTGRQAAHTIAASATPGLRWAIAGRRGEALERVASELPGEPPECIVADSRDADAIDAMVQRTRVVLTTVGPYSKYGEPVVAACAARGVDYVDITGEVPWVRRMIDAYQDRALQSGARIVPFCGFDSVPSDLGAWGLAESLRRDGRALQSLTAYFSAKGGFNGGTLATALHMMEHERPRDIAHPFLLDPDPTIDRETWSRHADPRGAWYEPALERWAAPFFMGPINSRVVRRTAALLAEQGAGYAPGFRYREALLAGRRAGRIEAGIAAAGQIGFAVVAATSPGRALIRKLGPDPGQGPSEATMDGGFFRVRFVGEDTSGARVRGEMSRHGDPGNRVTVSILCQCALALVHDRDRLPDRHGFLTPATAFGDVLLERLRADGFDIELDA